jgi:hypothetical protein
VLGRQRVECDELLELGVGEVELRELPEHARRQLDDVAAGVRVRGRVE